MGYVMDMSDFEIANYDAAGADYGEEVLCSGWIPEAALTCRQYPLPCADRRITMPCSLASADVEEFLQKMYASQL